MNMHKKHLLLLLGVSLICLNTYAMETNIKTNEGYESTIDDGQYTNAREENSSDDDMPPLVPVDDPKEAQENFTVELTEDLDNANKQIKELVITTAQFAKKMDTLVEEKKELVPNNEQPQQAILNPFWLSSAKNDLIYGVLSTLLSEWEKGYCNPYALSNNTRRLEKALEEATTKNNEQTVFALISGANTYGIPFTGTASKVVTLYLEKKSLDTTTNFATSLVQKTTVNDDLIKQQHLAIIKAIDPLLVALLTTLKKQTDDTNNSVTTTVTTLNKYIAALNLLKFSNEKLSSCNDAVLLETTSTSSLYKDNLVKNASIQTRVEYLQNGLKDLLAPATEVSNFLNQ